MDVIDVKTLVDLIVVRARVDKTAPDPTLRNGWRTDNLFMGDVDALVVGQNNDPSAYAKIGRQVLAKVRDLPEMAVLAQLAILRGERLLTATPEREKLILQFAQELETAISILPDGTRKMRCKSLFEYHMGIFYETYGRFDLAADAHTRAAKEADRFGDRPGAAISHFMETVCRLQDALRTDRPSDELETIFSDMEKKFAQLVEAMYGSALEVQWAEGNCPALMIEACVWLDRTHIKWNDWVTTAIAAAEKLGRAWEPIAEFVRAVDMDNHGDPQTDEALYAIAKGGDVNERRATAFLILARHAIQSGKANEAINIVEQIPVQGAQHVRTIAERMFK